MAEDSVREAFTRYIRRRDRNAVLALSRGICAFPGCNQLLFAKVGGRITFLGEQAHRFSHSDDGPCPLPSPLQGSYDKNSAENLGIFCGTHHGRVDRLLEAGDWTYADFDACIDDHIRYQEEVQKRPFQRPGSESGFHSLERFAEFEWSDVGQYFQLLQVYREATPWIRETLRVWNYLDRHDNPKLFLKVAINFVHFLRLVDYDDVGEIIDGCSCLLEGLYVGGEAESEEARWLRALLLHFRFARVKGDQNELEYCRATFGPRSERTINAMRCSGCRCLINAPGLRQIDEAERQIGEAQDLVRAEDIVVNARTESYVELQQAKILLLRANHSKTSTAERKLLARRALERHIGPAKEYFNQHEVVSGAIVEYFRFKALALVDDIRLQRDMEEAREWARARIQSIPFGWPLPL